MRLAMLGLVSTLAGCANEAGYGFATLESATVAVSLEPGEARDLGGAILTNRGYRVRVTRLEVDVESLALASLSGGSASTTFDPANPPLGYRLCHGGHCHADDGRLVDYADIEAELAGGSGGGFSEVARAAVDTRFDALESQQKRFSEFTPSKELPETELRKMRLMVSAVRIDAEVTSNESMEPRPLVVRLPVELVLDEGFNLAIDRHGPAQVRFAVSLELDGTLFDDLELDGVGSDEADGGVELSISDQEDPLALLLARAIAGSGLRVRWFEG